MIIYRWERTKQERENTCDKWATTRETCLYVSKYWARLKIAEAAGTWARDTYNDGSGSEITHEGKNTLVTLRHGECLRVLEVFTPINLTTAARKANDGQKEALSTLRKYEGPIPLVKAGDDVMIKDAIIKIKASGREYRYNITRKTWED